MSKRELILDALQELLYEGTAGTASVQDIASKAGIAKGGLYYYFKSKEEVLDALVERQYSNVIETCRAKLAEIDAPASEKIKLLLYFYRSTAVDRALDVALHEPQNAAIHQKSNAFIMQQLAPIVSEIFQQGVGEKIFVCEQPEQTAEILLSPIIFLLDPGLFTWTDEEVQLKLKALAQMLEASLQAPVGSFDFLYENWTKQSLN
ncbi:TetR/AcrR family transcriptional regulator [Enterococcus hulanensis]|uniref:TetR/AcrR family transcriptional regulator n=1 Tax=Enterococcus hulanensis TaxID=2559929 RepID=A0ABU3F3E0_9ENTE|nr:TetR/AcrR family transcriptional regulator [Enterococcus hulanensis]MDT2601633.1 TetR/AcrR family transcriptional regulator [Enterococcus hulanensis]MDT2609225.1 TetR/AcrR family transcriptional regulator [Enterococcus hulanensis]MDT2616734.1 TetR/AcrR family transcriptional regulator [Enterococcus hulanensis]MDT2629555.1 TetR/AcrR family transcriptional regulator [Enterococcus hulanensis]MDT2657130.1 TetR/AcrR family transcriptional regulator [Enterococcus hulanensis]